MALPHAAQGVYRLVGAAGAGARFLLGVGGARASEASTEAAGERAHAPRLPPGSGARARARRGGGRVRGCGACRLCSAPSTSSSSSDASAAEALREGVASPPSARPVRPSVSPREEQPSGALRRERSRGRPPAGACEEAPGPQPRPEPSGRALSPRAPGGRPGWKRPPRGPASA